MTSHANAANETFHVWSGFFDLADAFYMMESQTEAARPPWDGTDLKNNIVPVRALDPNWQDWVCDWVTFGGTSGLIRTDDDNLCP